MAKDKDEKPKASPAPGPAASPKATPTDEAPAPKKKLPIKAAIIVLALLGAEGGGLFVIMSMTGKPRVTAAAEIGDEDSAPAKDGHGAAKPETEGHAKKDEGKPKGKEEHPAKKEEGHGAKKEEGKKESAKPAEGHATDRKKAAGGDHGAKASEGKPATGGGGAPESDVVEILVAKDRFPNNHSGRTWLWDSEIHVQVGASHSDRVNSVLTSRAAEVKTGLARIWRTAQHNHFNEPGLETMTRQVTEFLDSVLGATAEGKSFIERVLIPRCVGYPTEY